MSLQVLSSAGMFWMSTVGAPGTQGAGNTGTQGMGVRTPSAAAVAAATEGFDGVVHIRNGGTLVIGMLSVMTPATRLLVSTGRGVALNTDGPVPKVQVIMALVQT